MDVYYGSGISSDQRSTGISFRYPARSIKSTSNLLEYDNTTDVKIFLYHFNTSIFPFVSHISLAYEIKEITSKNQVTTSIEEEGYHII
jgi:hypothetical protein